MAEVSARAMATSSGEQSLFKEPRPVNPNSLPFFSRIVEDIIVNMFGRLEEDPRNLARLACVCRRFRSVIKTSCYKRQCMRVVPSIVTELMESRSRQDALGEPPGGWEALQKLLVCCPGLSHAGVLLNCWDYGLEREIGSSDDFEITCRDDVPKLMEAGEINKVMDMVVYREQASANTSSPGVSLVTQPQQDSSEPCSSHSEKSLTAGKEKEKEVAIGFGPIKHMKLGDVHYHGKVMKEPRFHERYRRVDTAERGRSESPRPSRERSRSRSRESGSSGGRRNNYLERRINHEEEPHLAKGTWTLTREQGNKLLASRFRSDSLYICEWPGCAHQGERRLYKLFRGIFKNFKQSHVFRNLKDLRAKRTEVRCAFCSEETYDMVTSFCLRRSIEYHDDGEPVVRAYVCENGHVAGAWTDRPLYNL